MGGGGEAKCYFVVNFVVLLVPVVKLPVVKLPLTTTVEVPVQLMLWPTSPFFFFFSFQVFFFVLFSIFYPTLKNEKSWLLKAALRRNNIQT